MSGHHIALRDRLARILREEGEPYPDAMAVFIATNAPEAARKLVSWHTDGAPILAEEKQTGFPGSKPEAYRKRYGIDIES